MKRLLFLLSCSAALLCGAGLSDVHTVYLMPMAHGLDQYLINRLTSEHVLQVVVDPKLADAVLTDHLGESFKAKLEEFFPTPAPPAPEKSEKAGKEKADKADKSEKAGKAEKAPDDASALVSGMTGNQSNPAASSTFGRAKGTVFLVDAKSRLLVWSTYELPKSFSSKDLDRTASDIVSRLKSDLYPQKK